MSAAVTVFRLKADPLAQISGTDGAPAVQPTYAAAVVIDTKAGLVQKLNGVSTVSATCAVTAGSAGQFGQMLLLIFGDTGGITYTLSGYFKPQATVNPTNGKVIAVLFISDGNYWYEIGARATAE